MTSRREQQAEMLANRVRKTAKHRRKWARRNDIHCYRVYDKDIPELPFVIDRYEDSAYVAVYASEDKTATFGSMDIFCLAIASALNIEVEHVYLKTRQRQRGKSQYEALGHEKRTIEVRENGLKFIVNLNDYLDTGLFLDHRNARAAVREMADGCRFLNLFAYTGSFTVYAAAGGAQQTTTVDLSRTYLEWGEANMAVNKLSGPQHEFIQADVVAWLTEAREAGKEFDLIVLDPPTFSNSKRAKTVLDITRDHGQLIRDTLAILAPGGTLLFSTNSRRFRLDEGLADIAIVTETTERTVPEDFGKRAHRSWRLEHR